MVVHKGHALDQDARVVRVLRLVDVGAVVVDAGAVVHGPGLVVDVLHAPEPVPCPFRPLRVRVVACVAREPGAHVEEDAVCDGCALVSQCTCQGGGGRGTRGIGQPPTVLVVVSRVGTGNLPPQAAVARLVVAARVCLRVPHGLGQFEPLRLVRRRVGELVLGGQQGGQSPEALVVVAEG